MVRRHGIPAAENGSKYGRGMPPELLAGLFCAPVAASIATQDMFDADLFNEEMASVYCSCNARRREFAAGRAAARQALAKFGVAAAPIIVNLDGTPAWPAGFVGSISHSSHFCAAIVGKAASIMGVGFDAEVAVPLEDNLSRDILTAAELEQFEQLPELEGSNWAKVAFSAKEAIFKCYYSITKQTLDFKDFSVCFSPLSLSSGLFRTTIPGCNATAAATAFHLSGAYMRFADLVCTGLSVKHTGAD